MSQAIDAARLNLILTDLRLPAIKQAWATFAERSAACCAKAIRQSKD